MIFLPFVMGDIGTFGVVLIGLCFLVSSAEGAKRPPHILYIVADDLGRYNCTKDVLIGIIHEFC